MRHLGDYAPATVLYFMFTTYRPSTGAAYTLAGTPVVRVYKNGSTTQHTTTYSVTADFDTITGLNYFTIDTSADGTFYAAGGQFTCVLEAGTVDSVSVVGTVVGTFTLNATSALRPTTAGRTLDVSAGGEAGLDWANVGSPTTVVGLTGTTVKTATDVETDTADIQSRLPAALVSGRIDASVGAMAANVITATAIEADAITDAKVAADVTIASVTGAVGSVTGNVGGNVAGSVASVTAAVTVGTNNDKTGYALSATGSAALTEGYAALGAAATLPQLLYEVRALLAEKSISGTTLTTKKLDGATQAATYTLDDATTPSAITRAS